MEGGHYAGLCCYCQQGRAGDVWVMLPIPCASLDHNPILADTGGSLVDVIAELRPRPRPHFPKGV